MGSRTTEEIHKRLKDQDLERSPHKEGIFIGRIVDLDIHSLCPQKDSRNMEGLRR
jgi:hypothetical protein